MNSIRIKFSPLYESLTIFVTNAHLYHINKAINTKFDDIIN